MPSKSRATRLEQKAHLENQLKQRLADLAEKGLDSSSVAKDNTVKKLRADIRKSNMRLKAIGEKEKKIEEMARTKEEKSALPKKEKSKKQKETPEDQGVSKRQQKKKEKREKKESEPGAEAQE